MIKINLDKASVTYSLKINLDVLDQIKVADFYIALGSFNYVLIYVACCVEFLQEGHP
jgi:hypothetical protein